MRGFSHEPAKDVIIAVIVQYLFPGLVYVVAQFRKEEFLRALREDEEFRYAVLGLLGIEKVLQSIEENTRAIRELQGQVKTLQEQVVSLQAQMAGLQQQVNENTRAIRELQVQVNEHTKAIKALQEQVVALQQQVNEHTKAIKELQQQVNEHTKAIKELQQQVNEHTRAIKELQQQVSEHTKAIKELQEQVKVLQEQAIEHARAIRELASRIDALGARWGVVTEEAFRSSIKYLVEDLLKEYKVGKWTYFDSDGFVYGRPSVVDVDVLVRDGEHIVVEFKSYADRADIGELYRIGQLYEKINGVKPKLLLVASAIRKRAKELADELGIAYRGTTLEY